MDEAGEGRSVVLVPTPAGFSGNTMSIRNDLARRGGKSPVRLSNVVRFSPFIVSADPGTTETERAMQTLCIGLDACAPERRCFRAYEIAAGQDLFGFWMVEMAYGRVGTRGRTKTRSFSSRGDAMRQIQARLRRRAGSVRRIGCAVCGTTIAGTRRG